MSTSACSGQRRQRLVAKTIIKEVLVQAGLSWM